MKNSFKNILALISLVTICGAVVYRLYALNYLGVLISLSLVTPLFIIYIFAAKKYAPPDDSEVKQSAGEKLKLSFAYIILYLLPAAICFFLLIKSATSEAIISPWQVIPKYFFAFYFLSTLTLAINIIKNNRLPLLLLVLHYTLSFSIAVIVYKIGYGYDSFIHQATEKLIDKNGAVTPKTFYYLGQYALVIILHKIAFIPIDWLDKLLVPVLAGITLPLSFYQTFRNWFDNYVKLELTFLFILILPFSIFIVTTPQNLGYLFLLLAAIFGLKISNWPDLILVYLLSAAAIACQPIAGIPAILFSVILTIYNCDLKRLKPYLYSALFLIIVISLPMAFYILSKNQIAADYTSTVGTTASEVAKTSISDWQNLLSAITFKNPAQENLILNFIYLYIFNLKFIIAILAFIGIIFAYKYRRESKVLFLYAGASLSLFLSYLLASLLPFDFLIAYERDNYSDRLLVLSVIFLIPIIFTAIYGAIDKIYNQNKFLKFSFLFFACLIITTSLYATYPRFDKYFNSHGFSTGQEDIDAVRWINNNANNDYIVLADQQVSAAALSEYGFNKYYEANSNQRIIEKNKSKIKNQKSKIFYYPVPTGGPLYKFYLDMVYKKPSRETMKNAMDLAGVSEGYFVLNKYWWAFPKILAEAKLEADSWEEIGNGDVFVFKYNIAE